MVSGINACSLTEMPDRVLVPSASHPSWTSSAAKLVAEIEDPEQTKALLLHVFSAEEREALSERPDGDTRSLQELAANRDSLASARELLREHGFTVDVGGTVKDDAGEAVLRTAAGQNVDRIYLYNRNRSPVGKTIYGSSVQEIISKATRPVIVVPSGFAGPRPGR